MKLEDLTAHSFKALHRQLGHKPYVPPVEASRADDSDDCRAAVGTGMLTAEQLHNAARRYRLGKSRSGKTIYWLTDRQGRVYDGHIGNQWVTDMLRRRHPDVAQHIVAARCLFGLHLLAADSDGNGCAKNIAIVDDERTAVILSELFTSLLWMAFPPHPTIDLLEPLRGHRITVFPRTDPVGEYFTTALEMAWQAQQAFNLDITVSDVLERQATPGQKDRDIGLLEVIFESTALKPSNGRFEASKRPV